MRLCKTALHLLIASLLAVPVSSTFVNPASAQSSYSQYCHDRAQRLSGYRSGGGNVAQGAARGAIGGAVMGSIFGGSKKDRRRAAAVGALIGSARAANRPNSNAARMYRLEYEDCMRRR